MAGAGELAYAKRAAWGILSPSEQPHLHTLNPTRTVAPSLSYRRFSIYSRCHIYSRCQPAGSSGTFWHVLARLAGLAHCDMFQLMAAHVSVPVAWFDMFWHAPAQVARVGKLTSCRKELLLKNARTSSWESPCFFQDLYLSHVSPLKKDVRVTGFENFNPSTEYIPSVP